MPAKRKLLGQGYRGKEENEKLRRIQGCDNHCYFFFLTSSNVCEAFNYKPTNEKFSHILAFK